MPSFRASELLPTGFCAVGALSEGDSAVLTIRAMSANSACPSCGAVSDRVHSRYPRRLADLPIAGRRAVLMLQARRFRCVAVLCERRIFTERFDDNILKPWARRTAQLDQIVHCLALALGGRPAASFALRLSIPVSNDTLLRAVRRRGSPSFAAPVIVGIDDWAWRRNHRYGTLICDLERRKTIALLPDREPATAEAWLSGQPQIAVVARDRGGSYALATQKALPYAVQVADRWHLMENASRAFLDAVRKSMRQIRAAIGAATINPSLLTAAEKLQYEGYLRREESNATILAMAKEGTTIKEIVRSAGYSRGLVRKVLRGQRSDVFRVRSSSLEAYLPWLDEQWAAGRCNGSELWRSLKQRGFRGCLRVVSEWSARRRRSERMDASAISRAPSARTIARLMTIGRDRLSKAETVTVAAIESEVEPLVEAREVVADFQAMIRRKALAELDPWIERAKTSLVAALANGVTKDKAAVSAAIRRVGPTAKPKARSANSSWSSARCMGEENSIYSKRASWAQRDERHQKCVRAKFARRNTRCDGT